MASPHWLTALHKTLKAHDKVSARPVFQVATVDEHGIPRVRSQIYRESLTPKLHPALPLLLSSTDIRTPKVAQLVANPSSKTELVEICWWIDATQEQFRITAQTYIIPSPEHRFHERFNPEIAQAMQAIVNEDKIDWEKKRREAYEGMSGHMKASWLRPTPGSKVEGGYEASKTWVEKVPKLEEAKTDEDKRNWEKALGNFALMVFEPVRVDYVELGIVPNRRRIYTRTQGDWTEEDVAP
ncbi:hypothetical protein NEOLEDRAFT_1136595 [Neolentinus lepideus HHB14362 ss-1]|uniref:Pyridoxamine 5'-phosphate oxidase Alr4036 family FMN-binding domain-containing protein n=1 Tax=Neolentinus lepideus HHB14362 ss-1 TaxID=1314782 RepID=A0A165R4A7_9AGAM|nr:hypothetical protein NEOLEDRAFT_1136595 [Neolentinus lepideus HHB14362 ss-1]